LVGLKEKSKGGANFCLFSAKQCVPDAVNALYSTAHLATSPRQGFPSVVLVRGASVFRCPRANADMPDLCWTLPVARWSSWSPTAENTPDVAFIDPMMRRRLSSLSRMALKVAHDCVEGQASVRMVFASRHGEVPRTTEILRSIDAGKPVLPNAFSLSVLNAMSGLFGIVRRDRSPATAISAGAETLGYALLEAYAQYAERPSEPVLVVYADEPVGDLYGAVSDEVQAGAVALLVDAAPLVPGRGELRCKVATSVSETELPGEQCFATQSEALLHCLTSGRPAAWRELGATWQWDWHAGKA
jgi:hypothetical protein